MVTFTLKKGFFPFKQRREGQRWGETMIWWNRVNFECDCSITCGNWNLLKYFWTITRFYMQQRRRPPKTSWDLVWPWAGSAQTSAANPAKWDRAFYTSKEPAATFSSWLKGKQLSEAGRAKNSRYARKMPVVQSCIPCMLWSSRRATASDSLEYSSRTQIQRNVAKGFLFWSTWEKHSEITQLRPGRQMVDTQEIAVEEPLWITSLHKIVSYVSSHMTLSIKKNSLHRISCPYFQLT